MILDANHLKRSFGNVQGWSICRAQKRQYEEQIKWNIELTDDEEIIKFNLVVPKPDERGLFWFQGVPYIITRLAVIIPENHKLRSEFPFDINVRDIKCLYYVNPEDLLVRVLRGAVHTSIRQIHDKEFQYLIQDKFNSFFKGRYCDPWTGKSYQNYLHWVNADRPNEVQSHGESVYLEFTKSSLNIAERVPSESFLGYLDLSTTPTSEMVGIMYRLADGASIENGKIKPSPEGNIFAKTSKLSLFHESTKPSRRIGDRTSYEQNSILMKDEDPLVVSSLSEEVSLSLSGHNVLTALGYDGYNHLDAITVSRSFADKFRSVQYYYQRFSSDEKPDLMIGVGKIIKAGNPLSITTLFGKIKLIKVRKLPFLAEIVEIRQFKGIESGEEIWMTRVKYKVEFPLTCGCKITTRHGTKGVVSRIVPDGDMPLIDFNGQKLHAEVLMNPYGIGKRGCMGFIKEMVFGSICKIKGQRMVFNPFDKTDLNELKSQLTKAGLPENLHFRDNNSPRKLMCGYVYFIRVDRHDKESLSWQGEDIFLNQYGLIPEGSGQMWNTTMARIATSKGLGELSRHLVCENRTGKQRLEELFAVYGIGFGEEIEMEEENTPEIEETQETESFVKKGKLDLGVGSKCRISGISSEMAPQLEQEWYNQCAKMAIEAVAQHLCRQESSETPAPDPRYRISGPLETKSGCNMYSVTFPIEARGIPFYLTMNVFDRTVRHGKVLVSFS